MSYYDILNVTPQASDAEIKRAYRLLALRYHPDRHDKNKTHAEAQIRLINEAYSALKTKEKRYLYNRALKTKPKTATNPAQNDNRLKTKSSWMNDLGSFFRQPSAEKRRQDNV